jgi:hypothetical protein
MVCVSAPAGRRTAETISGRRRRIDECGNKSDPVPVSAAAVVCRGIGGGRNLILVNPIRVVRIILNNAMPEPDTRTKQPS